MSRDKNTKKFPHLKQSVRIPVPINSTSKFFAKSIPYYIQGGFPITYGQLFSLRSW